MWKGRWRIVLGYWNRYWCVNSQEKGIAAREPPWEPNGLPPMANSIRIALAKSGSMTEASHQPDFKGSCLNIGDMYQPCLPSSERVQSMCSMAPHDWDNGGYVDVFFTW